MGNLKGDSSFKSLHSASSPPSPLHATLTTRRAILSPYYYKTTHKTAAQHWAAFIKTPHHPDKQAVFFMVRDSVSTLPHLSSPDKGEGQNPHQDPTPRRALRNRFLCMMSQTPFPDKRNEWKAKVGRDDGNQGRKTVLTIVFAALPASIYHVRMDK